MSKEINLLLRKEVERVVEALLFSSHEPVPFKKIQDVLGVSSRQLEKILRELQEAYRERAFSLEKNEEGYFLHTRSEYSPYIQQLHSDKRGEKLSNAATEVLAIVAYRQPLTRPMIDGIRGVDSSGSVQALLERGLIESAGKKTDAPGRPTLYRTTKKFLEHFGIKDLKELP